MSWDLHFADANFLQFAVDQNGVVDEEAAIVSVLGMEGETQETSFISQPRCGQHLPADVQEGLLQAAAISQIHPYKTYLLCHEHAVCVISAVEHQHGVPQPIGHFCQAQLQAASGVLHHFAQIAIQVIVLQDIGVAVVLVREVNEVTEMRAVFLTRLLQGPAVG